MWLHLDLDGIESLFRIREYTKSIPEKWDEQRCVIDLTLQSNSWLNYQSSSILFACEVEEVRNKISDLLDDKIQVREQLSFVEPDFTFILNPKKDLRENPNYVYIAPGHEFLDISADLRIHLWNGFMTANYFSLCFERNILESLLVYLQLVTNEIPKNDKSVQWLIEKDVIRTD